MHVTPVLAVLFPADDALTLGTSVPTALLLLLSVVIATDKALLSLTCALAKRVRHFIPLSLDSLMIFSISRLHESITNSNWFWKRNSDSVNAEILLVETDS